MWTCQRAAYWARNIQGKLAFFKKIGLSRMCPLLQRVFCLFLAAVGKSEAGTIWIELQASEKETLFYW